jgi:zinc transport system substrate-binding protein
VTDIPPVHALVAQVMEGVGTPELLLERGANAHDVQLRPSQVAALAGSDLVVWMGPEMAPWLDRALATAEGAARLGLLEAPGTVLRRYRETDPHDHGAEHGAEEAHEEAVAEKAEGPDQGHDAAHDATAEARAGRDADHGAEAGAEAGHGADHGDDPVAEAGADPGHDEGHGDVHSGTDPHAWLDPANGRVWLGLIAGRLSELDPANAATYQANAEAASARIEALDAALQARLAPLQDRPFLVFHDAYGYFVDHYGLTIAGAVAMGDAAAPGAAHLRELEAQIAASGARCIFPEANHDPRMVQALAEGAGLRVGAPLDPEGSAIEPGPGLYDALLTGLADALTACLAES